MRKKRKRRVARLMTILAILAAVVLFLFVFRVRKVVVSGNERHTSEEIASGLLTDFFSKNTLYLLWTYKDGGIPDTLPYLDSLKITMKSPFTIEVQVSEKELVGYIDEGEYIYFDASGIVLEITDEIYEGITVITGASIGEVTLYQKVPTESSAQLRTILNLLELLEYKELNADEIRFGENSAITVYIGGIEAMLGQDEYLEEKVANLKAILDTMAENASGTLHLENFTGSESITFAASDETEAEEETDSMAADNSLGDTTDTTTQRGEDAGSTASSDVSDTVSDDTSLGADDTAEEAEDSEDSGVDLMVFNSSGQLVYNVRVRDGLVVDAYGNEVPGCYVNESGNVVDAYMNEIDPYTGDLLN